jgi:hypothetical protein
MIRQTCCILIFILFFPFATVLNGQVLEDRETYEKIRKGVGLIYNGEFEQADAVYQFLSRNYPTHPISYLYKGMFIYWQNFPLIPGTKSATLFEQNLLKAVSLAEARMKIKGNEAEDLLSALGSAGLLLLFYADNGVSREVISMAPKTYQWVMKSFDYTRVYKDFYFITGLYNYYREAYAEANPIYKPIMVFFPHGNKKEGLHQLKIAADSAIFLKAESYTFLAGIYQSYESDPKQAIYYSRRLMEYYKRNYQFRSSFIRDLLILKRYDEAETYLKDRDHLPLNNYFKARSDILMGIVMEKKYRNMKQAELYYRSGINKAEEFGDFGREYAAYGYYGLSRLSALTGDIKSSRQFRKQAKDLGTFDHVNFDN